MSLHHPPVGEVLRLGSAPGAGAAGWPEDGGEMPWFLSLAPLLGETCATDTGKKQRFVQRALLLIKLGDQKYRLFSLGIMK